MTPTLTIKHFGQIREASIAFGDLTVLVGPQASGKSIALQLLKLMVDAGQVQDEMTRHGLSWDGSLPAFLDAYFGEGMGGLWRSGNSRITWRENDVDLEAMARRRRPPKQQNLFFIPAQRVLALRDGWPRPFTDYAPGDPFAVREFSEKLRGLVEREFRGASLFPQPKRLKKEFRELLDRDVFSKFALKIDKIRSQKRLVLGLGEGGENLPYMVWSAGQREFVPLLLGMYWLMPPTQSPRRGDIEWVVLEEIEMGLHPRAISVVTLLALELVHRGYRVCLSTHSPQILEALWAIKKLHETNSRPGTLLKLFGVKPTRGMLKLAENVMSKIYKIHYFEKTSGISRDISDLDTHAEGEGESGWGGLSEFSGRVNDAVAKAVANADRGAGV